MRTSTNYHLPLPEGSDEMLIEKVSEGIEGLDGHLGTAANAITNHKADKNNPHNVTKSQIGLGNVENKSSATIRDEITSGNVTNALGFTPARSSHSHNIADITNLVSRLSSIESRISIIERKALTVSSWSDIASVSVTTSNTGDIDDCYNFISGSMTTVWGQTIPVHIARTGNLSRDSSWGDEYESTQAAYLDYDGNLYLLFYDNDEHGNDISHPSGTIGIALAGKNDGEYTYTRNAPITSDFDD